MGTAWGLVVLGAVLVYIASRPMRARAASAKNTASVAPPATPARSPEAPPVRSPEAPPARSEDTITPPWLDSLIGSDAQPTATPDPLDDAESIASVLRLWLSEDAK